MIDLKTNSLEFDYFKFLLHDVEQPDFMGSISHPHETFPPTSYSKQLLPTSPAISTNSSFPLPLITSLGRLTERTRISRSGNGIFTGFKEKLPVLSGLRSAEASFQTAGIVVAAGAG